MSIQILQKFPVIPQRICTGNLYEFHNPKTAARFRTWQKTLTHVFNIDNFLESQLYVDVTKEKKLKFHSRAVKEKTVKNLSTSNDCFISTRTKRRNWAPPVKCDLVIEPSGNFKFITSKVDFDKLEASFANTSPYPELKLKNFGGVKPENSKKALLRKFSIDDLKRNTKLTNKNDGKCKMVQSLSSLFNDKPQKNDFLVTKLKNDTGDEYFYIPKYRIESFEENANYIKIKEKSSFKKYKKPIGMKKGKKEASDAKDPVKVRTKLQPIKKNKFEYHGSKAIEKSRSATPIPFDTYKINDPTTVNEELERTPTLGKISKSAKSTMVEEVGGPKLTCIGEKYFKEEKKAAQMENNSKKKKQILPEKLVTVENQIPQQCEDFVTTRTPENNPSASKINVLQKKESTEKIPETPKHISKTTENSLFNFKLEDIWKGTFFEKRASTSKVNESTKPDDSEMKSSSANISKTKNFVSRPITPKVEAFIRENKITPVNDEEINNRKVYEKKVVTQKIEDVAKPHRPFTPKVEAFTRENKITPVNDEEINTRKFYEKKVVTQKIEDVAKPHRPFTPKVDECTQTYKLELKPKQPMKLNRIRHINARPVTPKTEELFAPRNAERKPSSFKIGEFMKVNSFDSRPYTPTLAEFLRGRKLEKRPITPTIKKTIKLKTPEKKLMIAKREELQSTTFSGKELKTEKTSAKKVEVKLKPEAAIINSESKVTNLKDEFKDFLGVSFTPKIEKLVIAKVPENIRKQEFNKPLPRIKESISSTSTSQAIMIAKRNEAIKTLKIKKAKAKHAEILSKTLINILKPDTSSEKVFEKFVPVTEKGDKETQEITQLEDHFPKSTQNSTAKISKIADMEIKMVAKRNNDENRLYRKRTAKIKLGRDEIDLCVASPTKQVTTSKHLKLTQTPKEAMQSTSQENSKDDISVGPCPLVCVPENPIPKPEEPFINLPAISNPPILSPMMCLESKLNQIQEHQILTKEKREDNEKAVEALSTFTNSDKASPILILIEADDEKANEIKMREVVDALNIMAESQRDNKTKESDFKELKAKSSKLNIKQDKEKLLKEKGESPKEEISIEQFIDCGDLIEDKLPHVVMQDKDGVKIIDRFRTHKKTDNMIKLDESEESPSLFVRIKNYFIPSARSNWSDVNTFQSRSLQKVKKWFNSSTDKGGGGVVGSKSAIFKRSVLVRGACKAGFAAFKVGIAKFCLDNGISPHLSQKKFFYHFPKLTISDYIPTFPKVSNSCKPKNNTNWSNYISLSPFIFSNEMVRNKIANFINMNGGNVQNQPSVKLINGKEKQSMFPILRPDLYFLPPYSKDFWTETSKKDQASISETHNNQIYRRDEAKLDDIKKFQAKIKEFFEKKRKNTNSVKSGKICRQTRVKFSSSKKKFVEEIIDHSSRKCLITKSAPNMEPLGNCLAIINPTITFSTQAKLHVKEVKFSNKDSKRNLRISKRKDESCLSDINIDLMDLDRQCLDCSKPQEKRQCNQTDIIEPIAKISNVSPGGDCYIEASLTRSWVDENSMRTDSITISSKHLKQASQHSRTHLSTGNHRSCTIKLTSKNL